MYLRIIQDRHLLSEVIMEERRWKYDYYEDEYDRYHLTLYLKRASVQLPGKNTLGS